MCLLTGVVAAEKSTNDITLGLYKIGGGSNVVPYTIIPLTDVYVSNESGDDITYLYMNMTGTDYIASVANVSQYVSSSFAGFRIESDSWSYLLSDGVYVDINDCISIFNSSGVLASEDSNLAFLNSSGEWNYSYTDSLIFRIGVWANTSQTTFNPNGGSFDEGAGNYISLMSSDRDKFVCTFYPVPTRDGYLFVGWSLTQDGTQIIANESYKDSNMNLWHLPITRDSYNDPSGKFAIVNGKWFVYEDNTAVTLYAKWVENSGAGTSTPGNTGSSAAILIGTKKHTTDSVRVEPHSVTFHANGGVGDMATQQFMGEESQKLTLNTFTRDGYNFIGWGLAPEKSVTYTDGQEITLTEDLTLYAVWTEIPLDISSGRVLSDDATGEKLPAWAFAIGGILIIVLIAGTVIYFAVRKKQQ